MVGIYVIYNLLLIFLFFWYNSKLFQYSHYKKRYHLILLSLIVIKSIFNLFNSFEINFILSCITYLSIASMYFKGSITKKILFVGFFLISSFISEMIALLLLNPIFSYYHIEINSLIFGLTGYSLSSVVLLFLLYFITKITDIKDTIDNKGVWYLIMQPIVSIIIIYSIVNSNLLVKDPILCMLLTIGIIIFNLIMCFGFADIIQLKNNQIEIEKYRTQQLHYQLLEEKFENSKKFIHDFKKHSNIINGFVKDHAYQRLENYLEDIFKEINREDNFVVTGNQLIDLSINANKNVLFDNSITIRHDVKIREVSPISDLDFNIVFSNILENAIESCLRVNGHFIKIKLDKKDNYVILKVINPCNRANMDLKSLKSNTEYHGYGIKNIENIVKKYNGSCSFNYDKEHSLFISIVFLKI